LSSTHRSMFCVSLIYLNAVPHYVQRYQLFWANPVLSFHQRALSHSRFLKKKDSPHSLSPFFVAFQCFYLISPRKFLLNIYLMREKMNHKVFIDPINLSFLAVDLAGESWEDNRFRFHVHPEFHFVSFYYPFSLPLRIGLFLFWILQFN